MDVLLGSRETLGQIVSLELEMSLVPLYENQLLLPQMLEEVRKIWFSLRMAERGFTDPNSGHILQVDGLFPSFGPPAGSQC